MRFHHLAAPVAVLLSAGAVHAMDAATLEALSLCKTYLLEQPAYEGTSAEAVTVLPAESTGDNAIVNWHVELESIQSGTCTVTAGAVTEFVEGQPEVIEPTASDT